MHLHLSARARVCVTCSVDKASHITCIELSMEKPCVLVYTIGQYNPSILMYTPRQQGSTVYPSILMYTPRQQGSTCQHTNVHTQAGVQYIPVYQRTFTDSRAVHPSILIHTNTYYCILIHTNTYYCILIHTLIHTMYYCILIHTNTY